MDEERRVLCRENQGLADYVLQKKREYVDKPKGLSENLERTFVKAYKNVCDAKDPITTLKDLSHIKGFGKLMLSLMKGYFDTGAASSGTKAMGRKRYIPQRNSAPYALLIKLHRGTPNEKDFMRRQELMDAADTSGLSHVPIRPEKGKGKAGLGSSKREWYSGWSSMTTLTKNGLVVKYSNPAKYKLTVEGREVANECIMRSGLSNSPPDISSGDELDLAQPYADPKSKADSAGPTKAQTCYIDLEGQPAKKFRSCNDGYTLNTCSSSSSHALRACSSSLTSEGITNVPRLPPLSFGEAFEEAYQINEEMNQHNAYSDNSATPLAMKHQTGFAMEWTSEEQTILENLLVTCSLHESCVSRYMRISQALPKKTTRDVAMRCRWMMNRLKSVQVENSNSDDPRDELLRQNEQLFNQISANFTSSSNIFENLTLFDKCRQNIMELVNNLNENVPEKMKLMPPLPEKLNDHLFYLIFTASN